MLFDKRFLAMLCCGLVFWGTSVWADLKLPAVFSDHMVLQRGQLVPVWGEAKPKERITVTFRNQTKTATADADGNWMVKLDPLKAGGPDKLTVSAGQTVTIQDVLVGEVWLGSGQSNMLEVKWFLKDDPGLAAVIKASPYPQIRQVQANGQWQVAVANNIPSFSAILLTFAIRLNKELDVPVGLMLGAVSGSASGPWISAAALKVDAACLAAIKASGVVPTGVGQHYDTYIKPLVPYGMRGVLWDQGEGGTGLTGVDQYTLMAALIGSWRRAWDQGDFPFLFVQKPTGYGCAWDYSDPITKNADPVTPPPQNPPDYGSALEPYIKLMSYTNTGMVISSDLGGGLHPVNKCGYGHRAADVALGMVYGSKIEYYGPIYQSHKIEGSTIRVSFTHVGQGLAFKHSDKLQGFAIAGEDKVWRWADARIDGDTVVLSNAQVAKPAGLRYAWAGIRTWANLFNKDGLPALPFPSTW